MNEDVARIMTVIFLIIRALVGETRNLKLLKEKIQRVICIYENNSSIHLYNSKNVSMMI